MATSSTPDYDVIIVGGGFYGCILGLHCRRSWGQRTIILEAGDALLDRASFVNQARVHNGYHYPRSLLTGYRSRANFDRFLADFRDCIDDRFTSYYAIGRRFSKVTAGQFKLFCERIGASLEKAPAEITRRFNSDLIEEVFRVREVVFNAVTLRDRICDELAACGVQIRLNTEATRVARLPSDSLEVSLRAGAAASKVTARRVFNCTYSRINNLLVGSNLPPVLLKHELAELALVRVPDELSEVAVTVMCGPFFSVIPFPPLGLHSLSHVRYTPHCEWGDTVTESYRDPYMRFDELRKRTRHLEMLKDATRYLPILKDCRYVDSLWEIKTVLPQSEVDDSRPILFKQDHGMPGLASILGSKIDNVYDMIDFASKNLVG